MRMFGCEACLFHDHVPKTKLHLIFFSHMPEGGVSYISKNNVPKCKLHFGEVSKKVSYIYKGPPTISKPKRVGILDLFNAKSDTHTNCAL